MHASLKKTVLLEQIQADPSFYGRCLPLGVQEPFYVLGQNIYLKVDRLSNLDRLKRRLLTRQGEDDNGETSFVRIEPGYRKRNAIDAMEPSRQCRP